VAIAEASDAAGLAELYNAVADGLTREHGRGHWSARTTERGVLWALRISTVFVARERGKIRATFTLATRKPWAIDVARFTPVGRALYLTGLAVDPAAQGRGLGRRMVAAAIEEARKWPADAVRLDA
jgi:ribosomal protein S18 acetylase RimI-like enzyme